MTKPSRKAATRADEGVHYLSHSPRDAWHLARTEEEQILASFEFSLEQAMHAYYRWKGACLAAVVSDDSFSAHDSAVLNTIRMKDRPKGLSEICRLLNREDTSNIQYAIRKLLKAGLIEKATSASRKATSYKVTKQGEAVTDAYADLRSTLLLTMTQSIEGANDSFDTAGKLLNLLAGMYDQSATLAAARRN